MSKTTIIAKIRPDGRVVKIAKDGSEAAIPKMPLRSMTEAEVDAAAAADPDARPMTVEELRKARRVPRVKTLRRALGFTQEEFAARYQIPLRHATRLGAGEDGTRPADAGLPEGDRRRS